MGTRGLLRGRAATVVVAMMVVACSASSERTSPTTTSTPTPSSSGSVAPAPIEVVVEKLRVIELAEATISFDDPLSIALHPARLPVRVTAASTGGLEVCAASLDGDIDPANSSWGTNFASCLPLDGPGGAILPSTTGGSHVAFAVRARDPARSAPASITVSYVPSDPFFVIILPTTTSVLAVTMTPSTSTMGVVALLLPGFVATPGASAQITQRGLALSESAPCDFGSEISCVRVAHPGERTTVTLRGVGRPGARVAG